MKGNRKGHTGGKKGFGTFGGVFTPTLLTILGVIMYLRVGWVAGNAGLLGAWIIILISFTITGFTGLSLSSITTNIRIGAGGAFSVISQSLGLEVGGSVGIPLYISQTLAVSMYIFGFRAGWLWVFPRHDPLVVDLTVFAVIFVIAFISAGLAFRIQYLILAIILGSLASVGWAAIQGSMQHTVTWWGAFAGSAEDGFTGIGFWAVFAVFFPASTGIMAGANMSGELKNPRKSIPVGTMSAIGLSLLVYLALAWWLARSAPEKELLGNYTVLVDHAAWGPAVLAGLLGATFSSALSSLVGAPRILQALGEHRILPAGKWLSKRTGKGEPRNALYLSGALVLAALMLRDLNVVAPFITMFFLITYGMINLVVFLEQTLGLVSFRPVLRLPRIIPLTGAIGCLFAMFVINVTVTLGALVLIVLLHTWLVSRHLRAPFGDVRSGLFVALAEWAAKKVTELSGPKEKTWKTNLLVPVEKPEELRGLIHLIHDLVFPKGFVMFLGLTGEAQPKRLKERLPTFTLAFREEGTFASWAVVRSGSFGENLGAGLEALTGTFFRPNTVFLTLPNTEERGEELETIIQLASDKKVGIILYALYPDKELGEIKTVNVLLQNGGPDWKLNIDLGNQDLAILLGYKISKNRDCHLNLLMPLKKHQDLERAKAYTESLRNMLRFPETEVHIISEDLSDIPTGGSELALMIVPMSAETGFDRVRKLAEQTGCPCLFTHDSGLEDALA
jgi:amino acid transporter